jgi:drug/metabolite transporter (DMT)-like permease
VNAIKETERETRKPYLKIYGSAALFSMIVGFSFVGIKACLSVATPLETLAYRFNFAFLATLVLLLSGLVKVDLKGKPKGKLALTAGFYLCFMALQAIGLLFSTSVESGVIFAIIPIFAKLIAGIFLNESTSWKQNIFVCMSVAAVVTMFVLGAADVAVNLTGLTILLLSSVSMACSNVMMRYVRGICKPFEIALFVIAGGCLAFNLAAMAVGMKTGTLAHYLEPATHAGFLAASAYLGVPSTLVSILLMSYMLAHMSAVKATVFGNLSTAISIVAGVVMLREPLQLYHIICTALIIAGVVGLSLPSSAKPE